MYYISQILLCTYSSVCTYAGAPLKPSIETVELGSSNVSVVWAQNRTCYSKCDFQYKLTLFNSTGSVQYALMTSQESAHIGGLLPGVHYILELVAMCEEYTSCATSNTFTPLHASGSYGVGILHVCVLSDTSLVKDSPRVDLR